MNNHPEDAKVRSDPNLIGHEAYDASLSACPAYANGEPRPSWDELDEAARWSWSRPTQRP